MPDRRLVGAALVAGLLVLATASLVPAGRMLDAARDRARAEAMRIHLAAVYPAGFDEDPVPSARAVTNPVLLGTQEPATVWTYRRGGRAAGTAIRVPVPEGYNGRVDVLVGIDLAGSVTGVRVIRHAETPDYGGRLVREASVLERFVGAGLDAPAGRWSVAPGDGIFDGRTGATVTLTALTNGVLRALRQSEVLAAPSGGDEGGPR